MADVNKNPQMKWTPDGIDNHIQYKRERKSLDDEGIPDYTYMTQEEITDYQTKQTADWQLHRRPDANMVYEAPPGWETKGDAFARKHRWKPPKAPPLFMTDDSENMFPSRHVPQHQFHKWQLPHPGNGGITDRHHAQLPDVPEIEAIIEKPHHRRPGQDTLHVGGEPTTVQSGTQRNRNGHTVYAHDPSIVEDFYLRKPNPETGEPQHFGRHPFEAPAMDPKRTGQQPVMTHDPEAHPVAYDPHHAHVGQFGAGHTPQVAPGDTKDIGSSRTAPEQRATISMDRIRAMYSIDHGVTNWNTMATTAKRNFMASKGRTANLV